MEDCETADRQENTCSKIIGPMRDENDTLIHDDLVKSKTMNSLFATVGEKLASHFPPTAADKSYIARVKPNDI